MKLLENISLASYTTFKIGGKARYFCSVKDETEIKEALKFARDKGIPVLVLGGGSNVLISDEGFSGLVIKIEIRGVSFEEKGKDVTAEAMAGENWDEFVKKTVERKLWGLENLSGIPGTVGAAPVQNIGAYGAEIKDLIEEVHVLDTSAGRIKIFKNSDCQFSYRDSFFKTAEGKKYTITAVTFKLSKEPKPNLVYKDLKEYFGIKAVGNGVSRQNLSRRLPSLYEIRRAVIQIRKGKFPDLAETGTAGSFWKNPIVSKEHFEKLKSKYPDIPSFLSKNKVKVPLAWILDKICNLKGFNLGPVGLWKNQPIVVVAQKDATASQVQSLEREVSKKVKELTGISIEKEVQYIA